MAYALQHDDQVSRQIQSRENGHENGQRSTPKHWDIFGLTRLFHSTSEEAERNDWPKKKYAKAYDPERTEQKIGNHVTLTPMASILADQHRARISAMELVLAGAIFFAIGYAIAAGL